LTAGVLACAGLFGCASVVTGHGQGGASPAGSLSAFPSQVVRSTIPTSAPAATPTVSPPATSSSAARPPVDLTALLAAAPAGAKPWNNAWGRLERPTLAQFVKEFYPASARRDITTTLRTQGAVDLAHRTWVARNSNQIDLVLMRFASPAGALSRYLAITDGTASRSDSTRFTVTGYRRGEAQGFRQSGKDAYGYVRARTYGLIAGTSIVLEAFFFSPHHFDKAALVSWTHQQLSRLD
jgi:hypothetical protein